MLPILLLDPLPALLWGAIKLAALVIMAKSWLPTHCHHPWPCTDLAWALGLCYCWHQSLFHSCCCVTLSTCAGLSRAAPWPVQNVPVLLSSPFPPAQQVTKRCLPYHLSACSLDPPGTGVGESGSVCSEPGWDRSHPCPFGALDTFL